MRMISFPLRLLWNRITIYVLEVALLFCAPFDSRNWYTLTANIVSLILMFLPRYLYLGFLQTRPNIHVMHHILISLVYAENILSLLWIVMQVGNYFPVSVLGPLMKNHLACSIFSLVFNSYMFHLFFGILLLSLTRLLINLTPFWYNGLDNDRIKIWVHISLSLGSIAVCLTGYRTITWNYCDWASYGFLLSLFGIAHTDVSGLEQSQTYPDLAIIIVLAISLHVFTVCLEWKREKIDPLRIVVPAHIGQIGPEPVPEIEASGPSRRTKPDGIGTVSAWTNERQGRTEAPSRRTKSDGIGTVSAWSNERQGGTEAHSKRTKPDRIGTVSAWCNERQGGTEAPSSQGYTGYLNNGSAAEVHHKMKSIMKNNPRFESSSNKRKPKSVSFSFESCSEGGLHEAPRVDDLEANTQFSDGISQVCQSPSKISTEPDTDGTNEDCSNGLTELMKFTMKGFTMMLFGLGVYLMYLLLIYLKGESSPATSYFVQSTSHLVINLTFTHLLLGREEPREFAVSRVARWAETFLSTEALDACKALIEWLNGDEN